MRTRQADERKYWWSWDARITNAREIGSVAYLVDNDLLGNIEETTTGGAVEAASAATLKKGKLTVIK